MALRNTPNEPGWPYNRLPVPDTDMDTSCPVRTFQLRLIEKMTSDEWECPEIARLQAICTPKITPENEQFVRTYHPGLRCHDYVFVSHPQYGPEVWLVYDRIDYITVAGRPCHTFPKDSGNLCPEGSVQSRPALSDNRLFHNYHINPRKILSPEQLDCLRDLFPTAIGAQVLVSGFLVVLMKSQSDIRAAYHQGSVSEVAGLAVTFNDFSLQPKSRTWISGVELRGGSRPLNGQGCLGLRLQLVDGESAVTTITHGFMADLPPAKPDRIETPELEDLGELSRQNAPIDKEIWLKEEEKRVGTISLTFDNPSRVYPFPTGYMHDLSLITGKSLPSLLPPPGHALVSDWASYSEALSGEAVHTVRMATWTGQAVNPQGSIIEDSVLDSSVIGVQYLWDRSTHSQKASLLWITNPLIARLGEWCGSVLCLGTRHDMLSKAIVFQNYQIQYAPNTDLPVENLYRPVIGGGFLLPDYIRAAKIVAGKQAIEDDDLRQRSMRERLARALGIGRK